MALECRKIKPHLNEFKDPTFFLLQPLFYLVREVSVEEHTRDYIAGALQKFTFNGNDIIKQCREQKFICEMPGRATTIPELSQTYRKPGKISKFVRFSTIFLP